jgi:hypothetical protein
VPGRLGVAVPVATKSIRKLTVMPSSGVRNSVTALGHAGAVTNQWPRRVGFGADAMPWGLDHRSRVWTGLDVLTGLVEVIDQHVANRHRYDAAVAIGCSPWLTDEAVTDALTKVACCLVVTKPDKVPKPVQRRLLTDGASVHKMWFRGLDEVGLPTEDGGRPVMRGYYDDVVLEATHVAALEWGSLDDLRRHATST